jgi:hypothetical protein
MFVGLVRSSGWEPPPPPEPTRRPKWRVAWRALAWAALVWALMMQAVPLASRIVGPAAGYGVLLFAVALGLWRLDRWCSREHWEGLREYRT